MLRKAHGSFSAEKEQSNIFTAKGLIPGQGYDITVTAPKMRVLVLRNVMAPKLGLDVTLEPLLILRGGFGVAAAGQAVPNVRRGHIAGEAFFPSAHARSAFHLAARLVHGVHAMTS